MQYGMKNMQYALIKEKLKVCLYFHSFHTLPLHEDLLNLPVSQI